MNFPLKSLEIILSFVRGKTEWSLDVYDACAEVLRYALQHFIPANKEDRPALLGSSDSDESVIEQILDTHNSKVVSFSPVVWLALAQIIIKIISNRLSK